MSILNDLIQISEGLDKDNFFHKSVAKGEFAKYQGKMYLHDTSRKGGGGEPTMLVTFNDEKLAQKAAKKFGGKIKTTKLGTFRIVKEDEELDESAEYAKQLVRGEKAGPGLLNKLDHWFTKMIITKDKNRFVPAEIALKQLRKAGFNEDQITLIRDAATKAANTAVETMHKKHGEEAVPRKYISHLPSSFGVFDLYLNVSSDIHDEFAALMRKLFDAKIDKIKDKLNIVKEDSSLQSLGKQLKPGAAPVEEPEEKTAVNTPPAAKAAADDMADDTEVSDAPASNVEEQPAFKVGDTVKPLKGPHKGEPHEVIHVFDDGSMNIRPKDLDAKAVKYRLGAAKAQPDEVVLAEGQKQSGSLFSSVVQLTEAKAKTLDQLKKRAKDLSDQMDRIILDGGRILQNDPLNVEFQQIRREMAKMKKAGAK